MAGNVTLFQGATPPGATVNPGQAAFGTQVAVSKTQAVFAVWHYSPPGSTDLPTAAGVWNADTQQILTQDLSPSWSGAAGAGWVSCTFPGTDLLQPGTHYSVVVFQAVALVNWRRHTAAYWTTGSGAAGVVNGALSAPGASASLAGQGIGSSGAFVFPTVDGAGQNYWCDIEVGDPVATLPGSAVAGQGDAAAAASQSSASAAAASSVAGLAAPGQSSASAASASAPNGTATTETST